MFRRHLAAVERDRPLGPNRARQQASMHRSLVAISSVTPPSLAAAFASLPHCKDSRRTQVSLRSFVGNLGDAHRRNRYDRAMIRCVGETSLWIWTFNNFDSDSLPHEIARFRIVWSNPKVEGIETRD